MTIEKAAEILRKYNIWRRTNNKPCDPPSTAKEIGEAIDIAADILERNIVKADIDSIIKAVTLETNVSEEEMLGRSKHREITDARAIVSWLAHRFAGVTTTAIGCRLNRNHATAVHYNKMVDGWIEEPIRNPHGAKIATKLMKELEDKEK